jgi:hypothetical protein
VSHTAAQILAAYGAVDVEGGHWPQLLPALLDNISNRDVGMKAKISSLEVRTCVRQQHQQLSLYLCHHFYFRTLLSSLKLLRAAPLTLSYSTSSIASQSCDQPLLVTERISRSIKLWIIFMMDGVLERGTEGGTTQEENIENCVKQTWF